MTELHAIYIRNRISKKSNEACTQLRFTYLQVQPKYQLALYSWCIVDILQVCPRRS